MSNYHLKVSIDNTQYKLKGNAYKGSKSCSQEGGSYIQLHPRESTYVFP